MTKPNQNFREEFSGRTFQQGRRGALKSNTITTCIGLALVLVILPARADEYDDEPLVRVRTGQTAPALVHVRQMGERAPPAQRFERCLTGQHPLQETFELAVGRMVWIHNI